MAVTPDFNLPYPDPTATTDVPRDFKALAEAVEAAMKALGVDVLDVFDSTDKTLPPSADALRRGLETKQNTVRLGDNWLAASVLVNAPPADNGGREYPNGFSFFKVSSSAGGWPTSNGYVVTMRAGSGGFQLYFEMYTGATQTDKSSRFWYRSKRDSNTFWQDWTRSLTEVDLKLPDNYKAPTAAITEFPEGRSVFFVGGGTGGQGAAWATAAGATEQSGFVETIRTGNAGYQTFTEMYSGTSTTDTLGNRQFKRVKRDSNSAWQPFEKIVDQDDLNAHNADYVRQPGYAATAGTGAAYTVTLSPAPAALVDGLAITIVPHVDSTAADPTLKIGTLGALPIRRQSGAQFAAGSIKAGQPLSLIKVGSYFLARSAAPVGTATAAQVLAGYTFQSEAVPDGGTGTAKGNKASKTTISFSYMNNVSVPSFQDVVTTPGDLSSHIILSPIDSGGLYSDYPNAQLTLRQTSGLYLNLNTKNTQIMSVVVDIPNRTWTTYYSDGTTSTGGLGTMNEANSFIIGFRVLVQNSNNKFFRATVAWG